MKRTWLSLLLLLTLPAGPLRAQEHPFIVTFYGGLFFPSHLQFRENYRSSSDLLYGFGIGLPINLQLIVTGDLSYFKSEALIADIPDSSRKFEERFTHVGLLSKQPLTQSISVRLFGGLNYNRVTQSVTGAHTGEQSVESERKIGYFAGLGIEHLFEGGRTSIFADLAYDYRRIHDVNFNGDYGGVRAVMGVNFILF